MALKVYIGQEIIKHIEGIDTNSSLAEIRKKFKTNDKAGTGKWIEICGLFSPASAIEELIDAVKSGLIKSITDLNEKLINIHQNYDKYAWVWCLELVSRQVGTELENITVEALLQIITDYKTNAVKFNNMILKDAEKEFDSGSKLGFGIDGDQNTRDMDFQSVRGAYPDNKFVIGLQKETKEIEEKADRLIGLLGKMK